MDPKRAIIIVDDDIIMVNLLKNTLINIYGNAFIYKTALSALEGLNAIEELSHSGVAIPLIISDWLMPEMKGDEFILKVHQTRPDIKTIMISGYAAPEVIERICSKLKLNAFITKPWDINVLTAEINKCVNL